MERFPKEDFDVTVNRVDVQLVQVVIINEALIFTESIIQGWIEGRGW